MRDLSFCFYLSFRGDRERHGKPKSATPCTCSLSLYEQIQSMRSYEGFSRNARNQVVKAESSYLGEFYPSYIKIRPPGHCKTTEIVQLTIAQGLSELSLAECGGRVRWHM